jgi:molybdopterin-containing oxidoreductase family iron-sulfur binding subunit
MADETKTGLDRRRFLQVLGVTGAGAAVAGCSTDRIEKLVPYLVQSEDQVPGVSTWYASTCTECSANCGLHVRTREGRAVKLEGNPAHPINQGKLCSRGLAGLQGLYNPDRLKGPMARGAGGGFEAITWDVALQRLAAGVREAGARTAVLSGGHRGTFDDLLAEWIAAVGGRITRFEPLDQSVMRAASRRAFGLDEVPLYDVGAARFILSFGADFLDTWGASTEHQIGYARAHGFSGQQNAKHVAIAPRANLSALNADEFHAVRPGSETAVALAIAGLVQGQRGGGAGAGAMTPEAAAEASGLAADVIRRIAAEFAAAAPSLALPAGHEGQHAGAVETAVAVSLLNQAAGNIGRTVLYGLDAAQGDGAEGLGELQRAMAGGQVGLLLVHEANPVYAMPRAAQFAEALARVPLKVSTSMFMDETAALCDLILPMHHALERWDDAHPRAGVYSLMQPVMEPVFDTLPPGEVLLRTARAVGGPLAGITAATWEEYLQTAWRGLASLQGAGDFASFWRDALQRGGVFTDAPAGAAVAPAAGALPSYTAPPAAADGELSFSTYPHSFLYDGRGTNKPYLLEIAHPVSKLTWHEWIEMHPDTAAAYDLRDGEIVRLVSADGAFEAPVWIYAGIHPGAVAAPMGFGHTHYGQFAAGRGGNTLDLLPAPAAGAGIRYAGVPVRVEKLNRYRKLATVAGNSRQLGRGIAQAMPVGAAARGLTVEEAYAEAGGAHHEINTELEVEALLGWREEQVEKIRRGDYTRDLPQWGMAIDLARCTGCSACVTACYTENNIPWVGEEDILRGREMTWIRIERYWEGGEDGEPLEARFVPMPCQHCANAPCEPVCPVYAAYHTPDGLNGQVYNRCVGTRYCANNCPYKVRYFNWYAYAKRAFPEPLNMSLNPDVTVRGRGVMEKCTFCVQRIRGAQNHARLENRPVRDGDVVTACAQACPSSAIVFGNVADPESQVFNIKATDPRRYYVLEDINTRPAVTYLAKVLNRVEA